MSASLQWLLIKDTSSYLVKNRANGLVFSREANNLRSVNSFGSNGLIHKKALNVSASRKKAVIISTKKSQKSHQPGKSLAKTTLRGGLRTINKSLSNIVKNYRAPLVKDALARATALIRTQRNGKAYKERAAKIGKRTQRHHRKH